VIELREIRSDLNLNRSIIDGITRLHVSELSYSLSSSRGKKTVSDLYIRLLRNEGSIVLAMDKLEIVGVLSYTLNREKIASIRTTLLRSQTWLRSLVKKRPIRFTREVVDAYHVSRSVQNFDSQMLYVTTLFVEKSKQNKGIASLMFDVVKKQSEMFKIPVVVDTRTKISTAVKFYERQGMYVHAQTSMSVVYMRNFGEKS
jgi:hypothetical protein